MGDPISTKTVIIDGKEHQVKVLPPGPEHHDEMVWRRPKAGAHIQLSRKIATTRGLESYIQTLAYDREETIDPDSQEEAQ